MYFIQLTTITTLCSAHEEQIFSTIFLSPYKFSRRTSVLDNAITRARHGGEVWTLCNMSMSNVPDSHNVPIFTVSRVSQTKTTEYLRCFSPSIIIETFHIVTDNLSPFLADTQRGDMQSSANFSPDYSGTGTCTCELHISLDIHISLC